jgi:hypothetical protein
VLVLRLCGHLNILRLVRLRVSRVHRTGVGVEVGRGHSPEPRKTAGLQMGAGRLVGRTSGLRGRM